MNHDAMSLAMFWTGALMVFVPIIAASIVIGVWWYAKRKRARDGSPPRSTPDPSQR